MFIRNSTGREIICRRGDAELPSRGLSVRFANVMSYDCYHQGESSLQVEPEATCPVELRRALDATAWDGTSVTAVGSVRPPEQGLLMRQVALRVGAVARTLVARGPRHWVRRGQEWEPSAPAAWQPLSMCWTAAFGGSVQLDAGKDETSGLPRPAFTAMHPQNPDGKGFTPHDRPEGVELPRLELLEDQLTRFGDLPLPGCFAPLEPRLAAMASRPHLRHPLHETSYGSLLSPLHVAPGYVVFPWLAAGTRVELTGLNGALSLSIPAATVRVLASRPRGFGTGVRLRAIHLDADRRQVSCVWQHAFVTERRSLPDLEITLQDRMA